MQALFSCTNTTQSKELVEVHQKSGFGNTGVQKSQLNSFDVQWEKSTRCTENFVKSLKQIIMETTLQDRNVVPTLVWDHGTKNGTNFPRQVYISFCQK